MRLSNHFFGALISVFIHYSSCVAQDIREFKICILSDTSVQQPDLEEQIIQIAALTESTSFEHLTIFSYSNMELVYRTDGETDLQSDVNSAQCQNLVKMITKRINKIEPIDKSKMSIDWIGRSEESDVLPSHYKAEDGICADIEVEMSK